MGMSIRRSEAGARLWKLAPGNPGNNTYLFNMPLLDYGIQKNFCIHKKFNENVFNALQNAGTTNPPQCGRPNQTPYQIHELNFLVNLGRDKNIRIRIRYTQSIHDNFISISISPP